MNGCSAHRTAVLALALVCCWHAFALPALAAAHPHPARLQSARKLSRHEPVDHQRAPLPPPPPLPLQQADRMQHGGRASRGLREAAKAALLTQAQKEKIAAVIRRFTVRLALLCHALHWHCLLPSHSHARIAPLRPFESWGCCYPSTVAGGLHLVGRGQPRPGAGAAPGQLRRGWPARVLRSMPERLHRLRRMLPLLL